MNFYHESLKNAVAAGWIVTNDRILVVGGGEYDRKTLSQLGFSDVVITNLSPHNGQLDYAPYEWKFEDAENLSFADDSFDWAIEHAALHHLGSPHKGLLEMLRVARKGIFAFEARDSLLMRLAISLEITAEYELEPAFLTEGGEGGFRNSPIPNYVTRWREEEIEKTVRSMYPAHRHTFKYYYGLSVPVQRFAMARSLPFRILGRSLELCSTLLTKILGKQGNCFGFLVIKKTGLQPWIKVEKDGALKPDIDFLTKKYDRTKYKNT